MATRFYIVYKRPLVKNTISVGTGWDRKVLTDDSYLILSPEKKSTWLDAYMYNGYYTPTINPQTHVRFVAVSPPLAEQTISGTVKGVFRAHSTNSSYDACFRVRIKITSRDGSVEKAILYDYNPASLTSEFATSATNRYAPPSNSFSDCTCSDGDLLIVEYGIKTFQTSTYGNCYFYFNDTSSTDLPENETNTTNYCPWIEFSNDIVFLNQISVCEIPVELEYQKADTLKIYDISQYIEYQKADTLKIQDAFVQIEYTLGSSPLWKWYGFNNVNISPTSVYSFVPTRANNLVRHPNCRALFNFDGNGYDKISRKTLTNSDLRTYPTTKRQGTNSIRLENNNVYLSNSDLYEKFPFKSGDTRKIGTFFAWFKSFSNNSHMNYFAKWYNSSGGNAYDVFMVYRNYNRLMCKFSCYSGVVTYDTGIDIEDNKWYHITFCVDGKTEKYFKFYVFDSHTRTFQTYENTISSEINASSVIAKFIIGGANNYGNNFNGDIDEFGVFDKILTSSEIEDIINGNFNKINNSNNFSDAIAFYNFEDNLNDELHNNNLTAATNSFSNRIAIAGDKSLFVSSNDCIGYRADSDLSEGFPLKSNDTRKTISVCLWLYSIQSYSQYKCMIAKWNLFDDKKTLEILKKYDRLYVNVGYNNGTDFQSIDTGFDINDYEAYHLAVILDGKTTKSLTVYLYRYLTDETFTYSTTIANELWVGDGHFVVGGSYAGSGVTNYFPGYLDEVVIFDKLLTEEEVSNIRNGTYAPIPDIFDSTGDLDININLQSPTEKIFRPEYTNDNSLIALWDFNSDNILEDFSDNNNDLNLNPGAPTIDLVDYKRGASSINFDRNNKQFLYIEDSDLPSDFPLKINTDNKIFTFCFWIKPLASSFSWVGLIGKTHFSPSYSIGLEIDGSTLYVEYNSDTSTGITLSNGIWHHVGCAIDGFSATKSIYIRVYRDSDGQIFTFSSNPSSGLNLNNNAQFRIGSLTDRYNLFHGKMDEIAVFNRVLSAAEIDDIRNGVFDFENDPHCKALWNFEQNNLFADSIENNDLLPNTPYPDQNYKINRESARLKNTSYFYINDINLSGNFPLKYNTENNTFTIAGFFRLDDNTLSQQTIFSKNGTTNTIQFYVDVTNLIVKFGYSGGSSEQSFTIYDSMAKETWYFFSFSMDVDSKFFRVILIDKATRNILVTYLNNFTNDLYIGQEAFFIGTEGASSYNFKGNIDLFYVFNRILNYDEIMDIFNLKYKYPLKSGNVFINDNSVVALYNLEQNGLDEINNNFLSNVNYSQFKNDNYKQGTYSYKLESLDDVLYRLDSDLSSNFPLKSTDTTKNISICFWVKHTSQNQYSDMITKWDWSDNKRVLEIQRNYKRFKINCGHTDGVQFYTFDTLFDIEDNEWYHITVTIDGKTNKELNAYLYRESTATLQKYTSTITNEIWVGDAPFTVGGAMDSSNFNNMVGYLDEIVVFNRILTQSEIEDIISGTYKILTVFDTTNSEINFNINLSSDYSFSSIPSTTFSYTGNINPTINLNSVYEDIIHHIYDGNINSTINLNSVYEHNIPMVYMYSGNINFNILLSSTTDIRFTKILQGNLNLDINLYSTIKKIDNYKYNNSQIIFRIRPDSKFNTNHIEAETTETKVLSEKLMTIDFNQEMDCCIITPLHKSNCITLRGQFRTYKDELKMIWEVEDDWSQENQKYLTQNNFKDIILTYQYYYEGDIISLDNTSYFTMKIIDSTNNEYNINLWNYVLGRPLDEWENTYGVFPSGRTPGFETGVYGSIQLDFNNLYKGINPNDPNWGLIDIENIEINKIIWYFRPTEYDGNMSKYVPFYNSKEFTINFLSWDSTNTEIQIIPISQSRNICLCLNYDNLYKYTPQRVLEHFYNIGHRNSINIVLGSSKWYDRIPKLNNGQLIHDENNYTDYVYEISENIINDSCETWLLDLEKRAYLKGFTEQTISLPLSLLDTPLDWCQKSYNNKYSNNEYEKLLSPCNENVLEFYKNVFLKLNEIQNSKGINSKLQLYKPMWGKDEEEIPLFYDAETSALYLSELGGELYRFESIYDANMIPYAESLEWLNEKLNNFIIDLKNFLDLLSVDFSVLVDINTFNDEQNNILNFVNNVELYISDESPDYICCDQSDIIYGKHYMTEKLFKYLKNNIGIEKIIYFVGYELIGETTNSEYENRIKKMLKDIQLFDIKVYNCVNDYFNQNNIIVPNLNRKSPTLNKINIFNLFKFHRQQPTIK